MAIPRFKLYIIEDVGGKMNYPEHIYNKYEIVEKDIYGQKHYGLVRVYSFFGIKIKRHIKVRCNMFDSRIGRIDGIISGKKWHKYKHTITSAIESERAMQEYYFEEKVCK